MNENINLCEILKDCPRGTKFVSYIHGEVEFYSINPSIPHPIIVYARTNWGGVLQQMFSKEGLFDMSFNGICTLVPSLEQPDWNKFKAPWLKKPKFDPKTLKAFDMVLIRDYSHDKWACNYFSHIENETDLFKFTAIDCDYRFCIPYNDDTKHLVGTTDEAPEYYRYWED